MSAADPLVSTPAKPRDTGSAERRSQHRGWLFGLVAATIWGGYLAVSRHGIAAGLDSWDLAFIRYIVAGALLLPWLLRNQPRHLAGIGWSRGIVMALLAGPLFVMIGTGGFIFAPLAHGAVIQLGTVTLMSALLSLWLVGERPTLLRVAGLLMLVAGLAVTAGRSLLAGSDTAWIGDLMFAVAGSMWAFFTVLQRRWAVPPLAATAVVSVLSGLVFSPIYLMFEGLDAFRGVEPLLIAEQVVVQGLLSGIVALFAFSRAVEILGPGRAALFPALAPAVAILIGIPLTGEIPDVVQIAGLIILSTGLIIAVLAGSRSSPHLLKKDPK